MYVPVFNKDTFYFSNIISSFVRDATCFVAQANSNLYGDSRISGPYGHVCLDIVKLKGGLNSYFVVGEISIKELCDANAQGKYLENLMDEESLSSNPSFGNELIDCYNNYSGLKVKTISAGDNRYKSRIENGLDK